MGRGATPRPLLASPEFSHLVFHGLTGEQGRSRARALTGAGVAPGHYDNAAGSYAVGIATEGSIANSCPSGPCSRSRFWQLLAVVWSARQAHGSVARAHRRDTRRVKREDPSPALKRQLAELVVARVRGWSQAHAAHFLGTDQARLSDLRHARLDRFSLEQLIRFVSRVDGHVLIRVEWATQSILFK